MIFHETPLPGARLIELEKRGDERGFFARMFCEREFGAAGLETRFVNVNNSLSSVKGTLRGLHYQVGEAAEVKVVRCVRGALWDVILDLRPNSPTFGRWFGETLTADNRLMMYVPRGFAHAILTLEPDAEAHLSGEQPLRAAGRARRALERSALFDFLAARAAGDFGEGRELAGFRPGLSRRRVAEGVRVKILFTGASSFTGFWFVGRLAAAGAEVTAALRGAPEAYSGVRAERARLLSQSAEIVPNCAFGSERFVELVGSRAFDVLCHHGAEARDYRSPDFDALGAAAANTLNIRRTLTLFGERGGKAVVATGSVFEPEEGAGPSPRRAFSPYGLSKRLTWEIVKYWCETLGLPASKFVIANPFGPYEEPRFVAHAVERWAKGETLEVRTPRYVRDNIHVDLLSAAYARFVAQAAAGGEGRRFGPCGYLETQGAFAERLGRELAPRLGFEGARRLLRADRLSRAAGANQFRHFRRWRAWLARGHGVGRAGRLL